MKQNTQKLLSWLYAPPAAAVFAADEEQIELVLPELTLGGRRSLVHYLNSKYLLRVERLGGETTLTLTPHGRDALEARFPVFSPALQAWQGQWSALIFLDGPKGDRHFRFLRQLLLDQHAFSFTRGVYLYPGAFPDKILDVCKKMYVGGVVLIKLAKWEFGDEQRIVDAHYMLSDLAEVYSGISSEINQLLELKSEQKRLTKKVQVQIYSVFDRLFNILTQDPGLLPHYYPQLPTAVELLAQLHLMLKDEKSVNRGV